MTDFTLIQQRQQLEQTYRQSAMSLRQRAQEQLLALWHQLVMAIAMPKEPQIWTKMLATGDTEYHAYDPVNRETFVAQSETALRAWLEERYYR